MDSTMNNRRPKISIKLLILISVSLLMSACSKSDDNQGSGKTVAIESMHLPTEIATLEVNNTTQNLNSSFATSRLIPRAVLTDPDTDYSLDKSSAYTMDDASTEIQSINYLLCLIEDFKYAEMVNEGPYSITINYFDCYRKFFPEFTGFFDIEYILKGTVVSSRENNNSPQIIKAWLVLEPAPYQNTDPKAIQPQFLLNISVYNNVDEMFPYGDFEINIADIDDASNYGGVVGEEYRTDNATFRSTVDNNGRPIFKRASSYEDSSHSGGTTNKVTHFDASSVILPTAEQNNGAMRTYRSSNDLLDPDANYSDTSLLDFKESRVLTGNFDENTQDIPKQMCLARDEFYYNIWNYNLYHNNDGLFRGNPVTAGQRVDLISQLSFTYQGQYGNISNEYRWFGNDDILPDGAIVTANSRSVGNTNNYTAHVANGVLRKYTRITKSLTSLRGHDLIYYGTHPVLEVYDKWILNLDANNDFAIVKVEISTPDGNTLSDTYDHDNNPNTPNMPVATTLNFIDGDTISFYDQTYKYHQYAHDSQLASSDRIVKFENSRQGINITNTNLFPNTTTSVKLYCYDTCPKGGVTQGDIDTATNESDLYHRYFAFSSTPVTYSLTTDGLKLFLLDDSNNLPIEFSNLDMSKFQYYYSTDTGRLTTIPLPNTATAQDLSNEEFTYEWATGTGPDLYYKMVTFTDSQNNLLVFDDPITINYTHDEAHDINNSVPNTNPNHGLLFSLTFTNNYLLGLPYTIDNYGGGYPISLADGTLLTSDEGDFVNKAIFIGQYMKVKPLTECSGLDLAPLLQNESIKLLTKDDIVAVPFTLADKPNVSQ